MKLLKELLNEQNDQLQRFDAEDMSAEDLRQIKPDAWYIYFETMPQDRQHIVGPFPKTREGEQAAMDYLPGGVSRWEVMSGTDVTDWFESPYT